VPEEQTNPTPLTPDGDDPSAAPLILIPVSAEDFARPKRRIVLACSAGAVVIVAAIGLIYKWSVDPIHARESYDAGARLLTIARYRQAILSFDRAIALKPDLADAYYLRAKAYVAESDPERAIQDFSKLIELQPDGTRGYLGRCAAYLDRRNFAAANTDCSKAVSLDSKLTEAFNLRGTATREMGDAKKAIADFTRSIELGPSADNYFQRGATYQKIGEHRLAIADFDQVITFIPSQSQAYFARAESRRAIGDSRGSEQDHLRGRMLDGR